MTDPLNKLYVKLEVTIEQDLMEKIEKLMWVAKTRLKVVVPDALEMWCRAKVKEFGLDIGLEDIVASANQRRGEDKWERARQRIKQGHHNRQI